jgi:hypothetical protein
VSTQLGAELGIQINNFGMHGSKRIIKPLVVGCGTNNGTPINTGLCTINLRVMRIWQKVGNLNGIGISNLPLLIKAFGVLPVIHYPHVIKPYVKNK